MGTTATEVTSDQRREQSPLRAAKVPPRQGWTRHLPTPRVAIAQVAFVVVTLLGWQYLPQVDALSSRFAFLDTFFISSPTMTFERLVNLVFGADGSPSIWPYVWRTFGAAVMGAAVGLFAGWIVGLLLASFQFLSSVFRPFVVAANAVPRVALIPIIVVIMGSSMLSSSAIAVLVVFFVALFNSYEGGRGVEPHVLNNAKLLGASGWDVMTRIRLPYALAWTLASLPVAVTFAVVSVVTGEILTGYPGLGQLIAVSTVAVDPHLMFAVIIVMAGLALIILGAAELFKRRVLHWWNQS